MVAGMSRSSFAAKFKETVGETPMEYLTRWRMLLAADRLREFRRSHSGHCPVARLRIRKRLQHGFQEDHGPLATAIQPCPGPGFSLK